MHSTSLGSAGSAPVCRHPEVTALPHIPEALACQDVDVHDWHSFVERAPGGSYQQTAWWALAKLTQGFRARRVVIRDDNRILAGAQVLFRPTLFGTIGYVPLAPIVAYRDPHTSDAALSHVQLAERMIAGLHEVAHANRLTSLAVQPPRGGEELANRLQRAGFIPASVDVAPSATVRIGLTDDLDLLLSRMCETVRQGICASQNLGVSVREARITDLDCVDQILSNTSKRRFFHNPSRFYLRAVWRHLGHHFKAFIAEVDGQAVSAVLLTAYGDTVTCWRGGWTGEHGCRYPNEALQWAAIRWAKNQNYRYFDLCGIPRELATSVLEGHCDPGSAKPFSSYKLGFGGDVELSPSTYVYFYNSTLRRAWSALSWVDHKHHFLGRSVRQIF